VNPCQGLGLCRVETTSSEGNSYASQNVLLSENATCPCGNARMLSNPCRALRSIESGPTKVRSGVS
jgi:hypothetical protein